MSLRDDNRLARRQHVMNQVATETHLVEDELPGGRWKTAELPSPD